MCPTIVTRQNKRVKTQQSFITCKMKTSLTGVEQFSLRNNFRQLDAKFNRNTQTRGDLLSFRFKSLPVTFTTAIVVSNVFSVYTKNIVKIGLNVRKGEGSTERHGIRLNAKRRTMKQKDDSLQGRVERGQKVYTPTKNSDYFTEEKGSHENQTTNLQETSVTNRSFTQEKERCST